MSGQLRAVVVGCGNIGPVHADAVAKSAHAALYGVCDILPERADALAGKYGCRAFYALADVLSDENVDVVHICTPHYLHDTQAVACAQAGKHLVVEKPFALNLARAQAAAETIAKTGVSVCAVLQNRYTPCVVKAKELIDSGCYGRVLGGKGVLTWQRTPAYYASADWRGKWATEGGGLVINQAVHLLDLLEYLGGRCEAITATMANRTLSGVIEVEDTAEATLYGKDGVLLHFFATNGYCANVPFDLEIQLEHAALRYTWDALYVVQDGHLTEVARNSAEVPGKPYWGGGHFVLLDGFYGALAGEGGSYTGLSEGLDGVRLVDGLYASARTGKQVPLEEWIFPA